MVKEIILDDLDYLLCDGRYCDHPSMKFPVKQQIDYIESVIRKQICDDAKQTKNSDFSVNVLFKDIKKRFLEITISYKYHICVIAQIDVNNRIYVYGEGYYNLFKAFCEEFDYIEIVMVSKESKDINYDNDLILTLPQLIEYSKV